MRKDVNYIMGTQEDRNRLIFSAAQQENRDRQIAQVRVLGDEAKRELRKAADALTRGQLLARSRHAARAEALGRARDRALRRMREGKEN